MRGIPLVPRWQGSSWPKGSDRAWRKTRAEQLEREPFCRLCRERGIRTPAVTDHIKPLSRGGSKHDRRNLRSLGRGCHDAVTAAARHGRPVRIRGCDASGFPLDPNAPGGWGRR
jgi:5-methylcytosine-specific restriction endonuclease McrA